MNPAAPGLFDDVPGARTDDPATSHAAADSVTMRSGSARARLLAVYADSAHWGGLTDEEAATGAGLSARSCWWKRCSELRHLGLIEATGDTRATTVGQQAQVCAVTRSGMAAAAELRRAR